jgi:hypothetical protein
MSAPADPRRVPTTAPVHAREPAPALLRRRRAALLYAPALMPRDDDHRALHDFPVHERTVLG